MNLREKPTEPQLAALLAECDDSAADHIPWVDEEGNFHLSAVSENDTPGRFIARMGERVKFRLETRQRGNGYVGNNASRDAEYVSHLLFHLVNYWNAGASGYIEG